MKILALLLVVLSGVVRDQTTGQPLAGVNITVDGKHTVTDSAGHYVVKGVHPGVHTLTIGSKDVPSQRFHVNVKPPSTRFDMRACSTTLDYSCSGPAGSQQNG
ncbi:MAG: carboxypeptidase regulatory-like domain-containing protein [Vulcanimicrobiaceae bacterium]|jgi:hypothetical protein